MFKIVETFSGIGAQAKALERIGIEHQIANICEWDINAIIAYFNIHKGKFDNQKYQNITDEEINQLLDSMTLSMDGKKPITSNALKRMLPEFKRHLFNAIRETKNLVSITDVKGTDIAEDIDLFTYSFPCQDLSLCGAWHGNMSGIGRDANNRSGMLWEVERILKEMSQENRQLPKFLIMENVTNILSKAHESDFNEWKMTLTNLGYYNKIYRLNAKNFGLPQRRERAYMISIRCDEDKEKIDILNKFFSANGPNDLSNDKVAEKVRVRNITLTDILKTDYSNYQYEIEAKLSQPNDTPSRKKIFEDNHLLFDGVTVSDIPVKTITTKQDRNPNSGLIQYKNGIKGKSEWRYLTPRECFLLMGFDEEDYTKAIKQNMEYQKGRSVLSKDKLLKMAGNSICVDVLEALFRQIIEIDKLIFNGK